MSKSNFLENAILNLIFSGVPIPGLADNAADSPLGDLYWALHTADPGEGGNQSTNEATYGGYARVSVARDDSSIVGMSPATSGTTSPTAPIAFPLATSPDLPDKVTLTHFSIGVGASGATPILYSGSLVPPMDISTSQQPILNTTSAVIED